MKYQYTCDFVDTEEQAIKLSEQIKARQTNYMKRNKPPHYTPWSSTDGKEHKFVVWYWR